MTAQKSDEAESPPTPPDVTLKQFQQLIRSMYFEKDAARGIPATFMWLMEEMGELSSALRETESLDSNDQNYAPLRENLQQEFADVLAWLCTIANVAEIDLTTAIDRKYGSGCPGCQQFQCVCPDSEKP